MAPKKRTAKKGKNALTRGRGAKQQKEEDAAVTTTATSETTDDNVSERQMSPDRETENSDTSTRNDGGIIPPPIKLTGGKSNSDEDRDKEPWDDLPSLTEELRIKGGDDGSISYITNTREHREFELDARKELLQCQFELENLKTTFDASLRAMRNLCPDVKKGKMSEAIRSLEPPYAVTFKDAVLKLFNLPAPVVSRVPKLNIDEPIFEESETEEQDGGVVGVPFFGDHLQADRKFPSPAKMAKFQTPKHQGLNSVFQFGTQSKGLSTNKAARLPKPGEIVYSESGSPILQRRILDNHESQTLERVEMFHPDGSKFEVDMVYRGAPDANKLRGFKEFARDVRGIAASRATSVRQNRVQPPRVNVKGTQSASKARKPEWR